MVCQGEVNIQQEQQAMTKEERIEAVKSALKVAHAETKVAADLRTLLARLTA
jgi:hypothetical protein